MTSNREIAQQLRARAGEFAASSQHLWTLADELDPPSEDDLIDRDIAADNDALWTLFVRVYNLVAQNPGITTEKIASVMGLPGDYPKQNSHHFTEQILRWLQHQALVDTKSAKRPYAWVARAISKRTPNLRLIQGRQSKKGQPQLPTAPQALQKSQPSLRITV